MASGDRNYYGQAQNQNGERSTPSRLTQPRASYNPRYSYQDSPPEQLSTFQSVSPVSPIDEDPMSSPRTHIQYAERPSLPSDQYPPEKSASQLNGPRSPYGFQPPEQVHPAYFAPIADDVPGQPSQPLQTPASTSLHRAEDPLLVKDPDISTVKKSDPAQYSQGKTIRSEVPQFDAPPQRSATERAQIYNPDSFAGPNGASVEKHMPGQLVHPNSQADPHWKHGLCEPDATCCFSIFCPCVVYGKTQYRLSKKTNRQDPTDLLGYEKVNGSCGIMALGCGFQWILASIQRTRIRKLYKIEGSLGTDCIKSLCCCCCVIAQDEREIRDREELIRRHAGPASSVGYVAPHGMSFSPPPR